MQRNSRVIILALVPLLAFAGCSTKNVANVGEPQYDSKPASGFELNVLDESYIDGSSAAGYSLAIEDYGLDILVNVSVTGAVGMKALYFEMTYDAENYRPLAVEHTGAMGAREDLLNLHVFQDRGTVHYGQVLVNYAGQPGLSGDAMLTQVMFRKQATPIVRLASDPPDAAGSQTTLVFDGTDQLDWFYHSVGDYDQNSEVNIADLTPLGANFGTVGPFDPTTALSVVDGDVNTEINIADITPIGANFQIVTSGYNIYSSADAADYPSPFPTDDNGAGASLVGSVDFNADQIGAPNIDRLAFNFTVAAPVVNDYYWVRPFDPTGDGIASTLAGGDPASQPQLSLTNPPAMGAGTAADPYIADTAANYVFMLFDPVSATDVSLSTDTDYVVTPSSAAEGGDISNTDATLNVVDAFGGNFNVTAFYDAVPNNPATTVYMRVEGGGGAGLEIFPDTADADWTAPGVSGTGTVADPYILPSDPVIGYDLLADDEESTPPGPPGNPVDPGTLVWFSFPPFIGIWTADGTFTVNTFTNGYVAARDAQLPESNRIHVVVQNLPN
ncbi:hypothetical protein IIA79_04695 [bacterium]|nr:hypothetical protein [bacterium]